MQCEHLFGENQHQANTRDEDVHRVDASAGEAREHDVEDCREEQVSCARHRESRMPASARLAMLPRKESIGTTLAATTCQACATAGASSGSTPNLHTYAMQSMQPQI
mmetsp:Transcript_21842/g.41849  ORF Transcript_21842/g.41849 Transcript_21842/m.41849 type:complete len:107 (-) Transcript_21842:33-353(-)